MKSCQQYFTLKTDVNCKFCFDLNPILNLGTSFSDLGFTEAPYRRNTGSDLEDAGGSSLYKSTRHLLPLEHYEGGAVWARGGRPTPATIQVRAMLGDACGRDLDCGVTHSRCLKGGCVCKDAYSEAPDKQECLCKFNKNK